MKITIFRKAWGVFYTKSESILIFTPLRGSRSLDGYYCNKSGNMTDFPL
jgi:hypothetical protein